MNSVRDQIANPSVAALILAAGKGTRMKSTLPKVLHPVLERPMVEWVIRAVTSAGIDDVCIILASMDTQFTDLMNRYPNLRIALQKHARGTGDAVASAASAFANAQTPHWAAAQLEKGLPSPADWVLICAGDTPAINPNILGQFKSSTLSSGRPLGLLGMKIENPFGYGRVICDNDGHLVRIVEEKDANNAEKKITLCNSGVILANVDYLFDMLAKIEPNNAQGEYYLTDIFQISALRGNPAYVFETSDGDQFSGINDRNQLASLEQSMMSSHATRLMHHGVTIRLPHTVFLGAAVMVESDTTLNPGVFLSGDTQISRNCTIGPHVVIEDSVIGAGVAIGAHSVIRRSKISAGTLIPPHSTLADKDI